jgi:predicted dehydrogenase
MQVEETAEPVRRKKIGFIGCGRVGSALAMLLQQADYEVVGVASRRQTSAEILAERLGCPALDGPEVARRADALFSDTGKAPCCHHLDDLSIRIVSNDICGES